MTNDAMQLQDKLPDDAIEQMIASALERRDDVPVPDSFAARVCASLPPQPAKKRSLAVGPMMCVLCAALALIGMFALAPHVSVSATSLAFYLEGVLLMHLCGIVSYLALRRGIKG